jgi:hypothetical protein
MKYFAIFIITAALAAGGYIVKTSKKEAPFLISGRVEVADRLLKQATAANVSCSIIAKNEADVPVAIKRVVNPSFPMAFLIDKNDLLIDSFAGNIKLEVQINAHGNLGILKAGDIFGTDEKFYTAGRKDIVLIADKMIGKPTFTAKTGRGNFFRTAAR